MKTNVFHWLSFCLWIFWFWPLFRALADLAFGLPPLLDFLCMTFCLTLTSCLPAISLIKFNLFTPPSVAFGSFLFTSISHHNSMWLLRFQMQPECSSVFTHLHPTPTISEWVGATHSFSQPLQNTTSEPQWPAFLMDMSVSKPMLYQGTASGIYPFYSFL